MSEPLTLSDEFIYRIAPDGKSVKAALDLVQRGAFHTPRISDDGIRLQARCRGSEPRPYAVEVDLSDPQRPRTGCNCGSFKHPCKHALGLLFLAARSPESFEGAALRKVKVDLEDAPARQESTISQKRPADLGQALLQAVLAEPEAETPRLVLADWLEEHGTAKDADRAEFIRTQIELAHTTEETARTKQLLQREKELWRAHKEQWLSHLPPHLRNKRGLRFQRGFLEELTLPPSSWARHGGKLFAHNPIFRVRLPGTVDRHVVGDLVVIPDLARIRELSLAGCEIHEPITTLKILFGTPFLSGVVRLGLSGCGLSTREVGVLVDSPLLGRLTELDLERNEVGPGGAQALAGAPQVRSLRRLSLAGNPIGNGGGKALAGSDHLDALERLDLAGVDLDGKVKAALQERFGERVVLD
jgi:uncharacterized protein (TIGR02996 family)